MAKKKAPTAEAEKTTPAKGSDLTKVISGPKLKKLMAAKRSATKDASEINGQIGSEIKSCIENDNLHRGAFTLICRLDRMEPESLRNFMDNFEYLYDASGLQKRAESVIRMPLEEGDGEEGDGEEDEGDSKVTKFPTAKQAAEAAE